MKADCVLYFCLGGFLKLCVFLRLKYSKNLKDNKYISAPRHMVTGHEGKKIK